MTTANNRMFKYFHFHINYTYTIYTLNNWIFLARKCWFFLSLVMSILLVIFALRPKRPLKYLSDYVFVFCLLSLEKPLKKKPFQYRKAEKWK